MPRTKMADANLLFWPIFPQNLHENKIGRGGGAFRWDPLYPLMESTLTEIVWLTIYCNTHYILCLPKMSSMRSIKCATY